MGIESPRPHCTMICFHNHNILSGLKNVNERKQNIWLNINTYILHLLHSFDGCLSKDVNNQV
jgi:hypothetical protein